MIEIERTFLAKHLPKNLAQAEEMKDTYYPNTSTHPYLRIRKRANHYMITRKQPLIETDASTQQEDTLTLNKEEYDNLTQAPGKEIAKNRYTTTIEGRKAEIDVFTEKLAGLILIDFEFENEKEAKQFVMPECCLAEVTQEEFIAGGMLAGKSYEDIQEELHKYDYKPIHYA